MWKKFGGSPVPPLWEEMLSALKRKWVKLSGRGWSNPSGRSWEGDSKFLKLLSWFFFFFAVTTKIFSWEGIYDCFALTSKVKILTEIFNLNFLPWLRLVLNHELWNRNLLSNPKRILSSNPVYIYFSKLDFLKCIFSVANKAFPIAQPVLDYLTNEIRIPDSLLRQHGLDSREKGQLIKFLKGLKISYEMPIKGGTQKRVYRVSGLGDNAEVARCVCKTIRIVCFSHYQPNFYLYCSRGWVLMNVKKRICLAIPNLTDVFPKIA